MKKTNASILIIDDQEDILFALKMLLKKHYEQVYTLNDPKKVIGLLAENTIDVVLLDMNYRIGFEDGREGIYFLKEIKKLSQGTMVILMTAFGKVETAVEGLKSGAFDYLLKPWDNEKLLEIVKNAVHESRKYKKLSIGTKPIKARYFIGESKEINKAYTLAKKVAKTDANVLILGANGTGKMVMAKYVHDNSSKATQSFVHVDLGSLSEHIFESELFGYAKGAFTDAKQDSPGRFEAAQNGTIFLDEIGNVPLHLQSKLLQVIQSKTVIRLGESKPRPVNVRIICATNANLKQEVTDKTFRQDLYYRINTMEIQLPSLKERKEDILPLAEFLLENMMAKYEKTGVTFNDTAKNHMEIYSWNGNIREMQNRIERAIILCEDNTITIDDLDLEDVPLEDTLTGSADLSEIEKITIERALSKNDYNISKTADELGLSRGALYRRIEKYGIEN
ncbi:sigma-54-dependent Fis family transcriptional regulator [Neptunitalea chrysea]|uniref:Sigma-54-dependent Fis family transcriptional regulator n=1 Tax=Neptunitalea chrysea TaxID=1647581 RepID=A0A9W6B371_9FLAO|nr:sigma-54 dependent transcriptional regulator [Neptunitalea chrysea]GLB51430.1 sigma-54-dependent Fis family transcriptional regulator [Neptunitalea chrysea]